MTVLNYEVLFLKMDIYHLAKRHYITHNSVSAYPRTIMYLSDILQPEGVHAFGVYWESMFQQNEFLYLPFIKKHAVRYYLDHKGYSTSKTARLLKISPNTLQKLKSEDPAPFRPTADDFKLMTLLSKWVQIEENHKKWGLEL